MPADTTAAHDGPTTRAPLPSDVTRPLPLCPLCGARWLALTARCQSCSGDLRLLVQVIEMADQYFIQAIQAAHQERWSDAAEHLAVTLALRNDDVEALALLGTVRKHQGKSDLAVAAWEQVLRHSPDREDAAAGIASLRPPTDQRPEEGTGSPD